MELKNTFLKANLDKVLMKGKGPFFHRFPGIEFLSALSFSLIKCPVSTGGGSGLAASAVPDLRQVLILPALAAGSCDPPAAVGHKPVTTFLTPENTRCTTGVSTGVTGSLSGCGTS